MDRHLERSHSLSAHEVGEAYENSLAIGLGRRPRGSHDWLAMSPLPAGMSYRTLLGEGHTSYAEGFCRVQWVSRICAQCIPGQVRHALGVYELQFFLRKPTRHHRLGFRGLVERDVLVISRVSLGSRKCQTGRIRLIICPAPRTVAKVNGPAVLTSPALCPSTLQSRKLCDLYSSAPVHSSASSHNLVAGHEHCQSCVPE